MMVVHEGDYVELTLVNPATNEMPHNIDFHAATGALGGAALTDVNPGEEVKLRFKATRVGTFVYHCAPQGMIPWHVVTGMSGTIMVLPRDGLKDDKGKLFLVIAESGTKVDLKALSRRLGAGRFSFGKPELLDSVLGVSAGSVTAFAVVNDGDRRVSVVIDQELASYDRVNCHPLENTATTNIALEDLLRFIRATGHELQFMNLNAT